MKALALTGKRDKKEDLLDYTDKDFGDDNIKVDIYCYFDFYYDGKFRDIDSGEELDIYDLYRVGGGVGESMVEGFCYYYLYLLGKECVDTWKEIRFNGDKFSQVIFANHFNFKIPDTIFFVVDNIYIEKYIEILEKRFKYPFIAKNAEGSRGEQVYLMENREDLKRLFEDNLNNGMLFQEYIDNDGDYRIVVMGDKVLGGFKRYNKDSFKNNISGGGSGTKYEVDEDLEKLAIDIVKKFEMGIAGLDFFIKDSEPILIEINTMPQFKGFEKTLGINFNEELFNYFRSLGK